MNENTSHLRCSDGEQEKLKIYINIQLNETISSLNGFKIKLNVQNGGVFLILRILVSKTY